MLQLQGCNDETVHTKLADVCAMGPKAQYQEALSHYHHALSLQPAYDPAKAGLERLEKLMRGQDPDAEEDADEELTEDVASEYDDIAV